MLKGSIVISLILLFCISCTYEQKLEHEAKRNNLESIDLLTDYYLNNTHSNNTKALYWVTVGAKFNDPEALYNLADLITDSMRIFSLVQKAAFLEYPPAMFAMAVHYLDEPQPDNDSAFFWLNGAANEGDKNDYKMLGDFYYKGIGTKQDYNMALLYYKKGCAEYIENNEACCDSVLSMLKNKPDTLDYRYWKEHTKEVVIPMNFK